MPFFRRSLLAFVATLTTHAIAQSSLVPVAPAWNPNEILNWSPATDPDAPYNRSRVPLAPRVQTPKAAENAVLNALWNVNPHARPGEARVQAVTTFNTIPAAATHGWRTTRLYAPTMWQYTDNMVSWGTSDRNTQIILTPTAHMIEAAHRNGVRIYGKVFFPWNNSSDTRQRLRELLQKNGNTFPVADKMIEAAIYFGFDGYFINQENHQNNSAATRADAQNMRDFIVYFRQKAASLGAPHLRIVWYDAMIENGTRSFQNRFNTSNDGYMKSGPEITTTTAASPLVAHEMFLNFWWYRNSTYLSSSRSHAQSIGIDPYDIYAGIWTENYSPYGRTLDENSSGGLDITWNYLFPEGQPHHTSLALFGGETPFVKGNSPSAVLTQEQIYWSGPNQNPANTAIPAGSSTPNWNGIAHYIPTHTAITSLPFVTNFNVGQGERYRIDGIQRMTGAWTNASVQDILPTWRWIVESSGAKTITPSLDFDDSYYGPTSLRVSGTLTPGNPQNVKLYQMHLPVTEATNLRMIYKPGAVNAAQIQVGLVFEDAPTTVVYSPSALASSPSQWLTLDFPLGAHAGRRIVALSLRFLSSSTIAGYSARIGRIQISDGPSIAPAAPTGLVVDASARNPENAFSTQARLRWNESPGAVRYYNVYYRRNLAPAGDNEVVWLGATANDRFFAQDIRPIGSETEGFIQIEAVSPTYGVSPRISIPITLAARPDLSNKLSGRVIGTTGAWSGGTVNTRDKVFDGNIDTYFDSPNSNGDWAGLDFGPNNAKRITAIRFSPRNSSTSWQSRMVGGRFQGANTPDFQNAVTLFTVDSTPAYREYQTVLVENPTPFRYVRYLSPNGGHCNVSEVEFYGVPQTSYETISDNSDASTVASGEWVNSTAITGYFGVNFQHDNNTAKGAKTVIYRPTLHAGTYEVFGRWTSTSNRASNVPVDIVHTGGTTTVTVDQTVQGGQWISLGSYSFSAGTAPRVIVRNAGTNGFVVVDAFRFVTTTPPPTPEPTPQPTPQPTPEPTPEPTPKPIWYDTL